MKKQINSKTVWFNAIMLILFIANLIDGNFLQIFGIENTKNLVIVQGFITAIGNYILRMFFTSQPITTQNDIETK